jgi:hypothetical protein
MQKLAVEIDRTGSSVLELPWDPKVLADTLSLEYTRIVLFTDGRGHVLHRESRTTPPAHLPELCDILLGAVRQTGLQLGLGEATTVACMYHDGIIVAARSPTTQVSAYILAQANGNLGQLLNQLRRLFVRGIA